MGVDASPIQVLKLITSGLSLAASQLISLEVSQVSAADLQTAWKKVGTEAPTLLRGMGAYWMDVDPNLRQVVVGVDASKATESGIEAIEAVAPGLVSVLPGEGGGSRAERSLHDAAPHWGGSKITRFGQDPDNSWCSSGFGARRTANNAAVSVTAAHCSDAQNGSDWYSYEHFYGTMNAIYGYPDYDQGRLQGSTHIGYIATNGGEDTQTSRAVRGATDPVIGEIVCQSGVTSYAECGIRVNSVTATYCDNFETQTGCTTYLIAGRDPDGTIVTRLGDSGGPVYRQFSNAEAGIRGMVIAFTEGGRRTFAERYRSIENHLGITIMVAP